MMQTWMFEELEAVIGGFHDGQLKPRSSGRPGGMSEDGGTGLARHVGCGSLRLENSQEAVGAMNHGWRSAPKCRAMTTRLEGKAEHVVAAVVVSDADKDTRWEWGWG